jgi:uncharacterized SAM-binding protein YcdF (DUF218 family)
MDANGLQTALVVSDCYHLFRAGILFRYYGMTIQTSPAQASQGALGLDDAIVGGYHESVGMVFDLLRMLLHLNETQ